MFYDQIAHYYDLIFKESRKQLAFILEFTPGASRDKSILDIGCGTGNLTIPLAEHFGQVTAVDLEPDMLETARNKASGLKISFHSLNMLNLGSAFPDGSFDSIVSFGNTLAHLSSIKEIKQFFALCRRLLRPEGVLMLQTTNFQKVLQKGSDALPLIENKLVRFERTYHYSETENRIHFKTALLIKKTDEIIENTIPLYPIVDSELRNALNAAGFESIATYGDFSCAASSTTSPALIGTAKKADVVR